MFSEPESPIVPFVLNIGVNLDGTRELEDITADSIDATVQQIESNLSAIERTIDETSETSGQVLRRALSRQASILVDRLNSIQSERSVLVSTSTPDQTNNSPNHPDVFFESNPSSVEASVNQAPPSVPVVASAPFQIYQDTSSQLLGVRPAIIVRTPSTVGKENRDPEFFDSSFKMPDNTEDDDRERAEARKTGRKPSKS